MAIVIDCFHVGKYAVLVFDNVSYDFKKVKIDDNEYSVTIPYDIPNSIAIDSELNFKNKQVEFLK